MAPQPFEKPDPVSPLTINSNFAKDLRNLISGQQETSEQLKAAGVDLRAIFNLLMPATDMSSGVESEARGILTTTQVQFTDGEELSVEALLGNHICVVFTYLHVPVQTLAVTIKSRNENAPGTTSYKFGALQVDLIESARPDQTIQSECDSSGTVLYFKGLKAGTNYKFQLG